MWKNRKLLRCGVYRQSSVTGEYDPVLETMYVQFKGVDLNNILNHTGEFFQYNVQLPIEHEIFRLVDGMIIVPKSLFSDLMAPISEKFGLYVTGDRPETLIRITISTLLQKVGLYWNEISDSGESGEPADPVEPNTSGSSADSLTTQTSMETRNTLGGILLLINDLPITVNDRVRITRKLKGAINRNNPNNAIEE